MYNYTALGNVTNLMQLTQVVNTHFMNGLLGILLLIGVGTVLLSSYYWSTRDIQNSILATSFVLFIMGILMNAMSLITGIVLLGLFAILAMACAFTWKR